MAEFEKEYNENNENALPYITKAISMNPQKHQFYFIRMEIYHALGKNDLMMEDDKICSKLLEQGFKRTEISITLLVVISIVLAILYIFFK